MRIFLTGLTGLLRIGIVPIGMESLKPKYPLPHFHVHRSA